MNKKLQDLFTYLFWHPGLGAFDNSLIWAMWGMLYVSIFNRDIDPVCLPVIGAFMLLLIVRHVRRRYFRN